MWDDVPEPFDAPAAQAAIHLTARPEKDIVPEATSTAQPISDQTADSVSPLAAIQRVAGSHVFIEGDNYPALRYLCRDAAEYIDRIYIDPPYNTGTTAATYNDHRFSTVRPDGTPLTKGAPQRHAAWLSFMARRLTAARTLLKSDGCIFISIGEAEYPRLRLLCDDIFGEANFVNNFMYLHGKGKKDRWSRTMQQSTVCYAKDKARLSPFAVIKKTDWAKHNRDNDARGPWFSGSISFSEQRSNPRHKNYFSITSPSGKIWTRQWLLPQAALEKLIRDECIYWGKPPDYADVPRRKIFNGTEARVIPQNIIRADSTRAAQAYLDSLFGGHRVFTNPKPVNLIEQLLAMTQPANNAVILDFFAGSGTTLEAVERLNRADGGTRSCILIQSAEPIRPAAACRTTSSAAVARFQTIADIAYERCRTVLAATHGTLRYYTVS
ncbi:MAG: site-specific DNA-methyltransferase [Treponema sp.]|nr:site-specific DNA-methyltransferase [Treponema sp.]